MEKNPRLSNQNLSKGQIADSKKGLETTKWPRHSKTREQNFNGPRAEHIRNNNSKSATGGKTRNQTNYNYDKRPKSRLEASNGPRFDASTAELDRNGLLDEDHKGTGLKLCENSDSIAVRHDLHSVFSPGSKKQSLNHLLNFHYAPRERDLPSRFSKTGNSRGYTRKIGYNKENFLQANCQFVVRADGDYTALLMSPDQLVEWEKIEQIHVLNFEEPQCPICLYPPVAAKMTKCGHIYCWPCILHYLALSDKSWRKCPICYDAVHTPDLKSVVSMPLRSYTIGETVTFQLMCRERCAATVTTAINKASSTATIPCYYADANNTILSKLLLADTSQIMQIIHREQNELENQIVVDGIDCPENTFVEQALNQLEERKVFIQNSKVIVFPSGAQQKQNKSLCFETCLDGPSTGSAKLNATENTEHQMPADFMIDASSDFALSDIDITPTSLCNSLNYYYFYQSTDGQPLFLHSLNTRMLQTMYGSLDKSPYNVSGKILHKDTCSMSEELRKRLKYLQHLPVCTQFEVVEIEFDLDIVSADILEQFKDEINSRRKTRQRRARAERIRERQILEFNERQLGKSLARSADIPIDSQKHFPTCGGAELYDYCGLPSLEESHVSEASGSSGLPNTRTSWSKMVSTASGNQSFTCGNSSNSFAALAAIPPKYIQITGTRMANTSSRTRLSSGSDYEENDETEDARPPQFRNDLSIAIEAALEKVSLNCSTGSSSVLSGLPNTKTSNGASNGGKKKKNKKTVLFSSGMNRN